jgi:outer membrane protein OmpA-like peptidoglycan-associated protein
MKSRSLWTLAFSVALAGCSSAPKISHPANAKPQDEISRLEDDIDTALDRQYDVVAHKDFGRSQKHLDEAKRGLSSGHKPEDIWRDLDEARFALTRAEATYARRQGLVQDVLDQRQAAIDAGARRYSRSERNLTALDDSFRSNASTLDHGRDSQIWDRARTDYKGAEIIAIQEAKVGDAREMIEQARHKGAAHYAPKTLLEARGDYDAALKAIADFPHDDAKSQDQVVKAKQSAQNLLMVTNEARRVAHQSNEQVGRELVATKKTTDQLKGELHDSEIAANLKGQALVDKEAQLRGLSAQEAALARDKRFNQRLAEARQQFKPDEAEVYRDGDKLLIRLKKVGFEIGKADLPARSMPLFAKVKTVIQELNAKDVVVEGHTDSIGKAAINKPLSKERAEVVAQYLKPATDADVKAVGYGYERPITSNKTKAGRAANRRVDILITPSQEL